MIRERQREGIELAKKRGAYKGRAPSLTADQVQHARRAAAAGVPKAKIARELGCSLSVLYDAIAGRGAYAPLSAAPGQTLRGAAEIELPLGGRQTPGTGW